MKLHNLATLFLLIALLAFPFAVMAQGESTEEAPVIEVTEAAIETPLGDVVVSPDNETVEDNFQVQLIAFVAIVITAVWNLIYIPVAAPLVQLFTSVVKRLPVLSGTPSTMIAFFFTVVAWLVFVVMSQLGFGDRFDSVMTGLTTIASAVFGIPVTQAIASKMHAYAQQNGVPVLGHSRTMPVHNPSDTRD